MFRCHLTAPQTVTRRRPWGTPRILCGKTAPTRPLNLARLFYGQSMRGFATSAPPDRSSPDSVELTASGPAGAHHADQSVTSLTAAPGGDEVDQQRSGTAGHDDGEGPALPAERHVTTIATASANSAAGSAAACILSQAAADLATGQAAKPLAEHPPGDDGARPGSRGRIRRRARRPPGSAGTARRRDAGSRRCWSPSSRRRSAPASCCRAARRTLAAATGTACTASGRARRPRTRCPGTGRPASLLLP